MQVFTIDVEPSNFKALLSDPKIHRLCLETTSRISKLWQLSDNDALRLLGLSCDDGFESIQSMLENYDKPFHLNEIHLTRFSSLLGIFKALETLVDNNELADQWINRPNDHFSGKHPLDIMLDSYEGLISVKNYLQEICG